MTELEITNLFEQSNDSKNKDFYENINSNLRVVTSFDKTKSSFEWLDIMEDTIKYLDNILRNPNRFIINEEDIVKVELAKRVTVESIKHLSKNTNLIQDIDKKTGDVRPSKILNINKEESFNTYENRFIYSLIKNMRMFIEKKKRNISNLSMSLKDNKKMEYNGSSKLGKENISISMMIDSKLSEQKNQKDDSGLSVSERIEKIEGEISALTCSTVYQSIDKLHITLVTSPIKKTNVILKNVNFQYAVKLWNYLSEQIELNDKITNESSEFEEKGMVKKLLDEDIFLMHSIFKSTDLENQFKGKAKAAIEDKKVTKELTDALIEKIIELNPDMSEKDINKLITDKLLVMKTRKLISLKPIEDKFKE